MAEITMPKLSDTMTEGTLIQWKKKKGDKVSMGEVIAEVETDKATMEMEAFEDGIISEIYVKEGEKVVVGAKIARIGDAKDAGANPEPAAPAEAPVAPAQIEAKTPKSEPVAETQAPQADPRRVKSSPLARKVAAAMSVDLAAIAGTGPGGRIIQRDVLAAGPESASSPPQKVAAPGSAGKAATPAPRTHAPTLQDRRVPLSGMRKIVADRLVLSKTQIPHFYLHIEVDAAPLARLRGELNVIGEQSGNKISINDLILKAAAMALARVPKVNASFAGDAIVEYGSVHLAVAVALDDGLVTPIIRDAQRKSLNEINLQVKDLVARARGKKLKPEEFQGGTFTVSNLGAYGIDRFDAIINPPQAAILSVSGIVKKPVVNSDGVVVAGQRMDLGLSCDHRVVDGALGAQFLAALRQLVEHPLQLVL